MTALILIGMLVLVVCFLALIFEVVKLRKAIQGAALGVQVGVPRESQEVLNAIKPPPTGDFPLPEPPLVERRPRSAIPAPNIVEILRLDGDLWQHAGWVRVGSKAWRHARETPGCAVRDSKGHTQEGKG